MSWGMMGVMELEGWRKGPWTAEEDRLLMDYVRLHGEGRWNSVARLAGLKRNGKSCRLRWVNYLRPDLKRGQITPHEESIILDLHARWGNRWSTIARSLPGRTDNEIKNYWRTHFKKKTKASSDKAKSKLLRRQQFQQQMQQLDHQADMKRFMSLMEESDNICSSAHHYKTWSMMMPPPHVSALDQHTTMASAHAEQPSYWSPSTSTNNNVVEPLNEDTIMWDHGWWNLDESLGAKAAPLHNFVRPLC